MIVRAGSVLIVVASILIIVVIWIVGVIIVVIIVIVVVVVIVDMTVQAVTIAIAERTVDNWMIKWIIVVAWRVKMD